MKPFTKLESNICPLDIANIDTDQIIPKQFLKRIERTGFGQYLFYDWRFNADGVENTEFNMNKPEFRNAKILLASENFGCGSSREHAPWALLDYGFEVIIAPSFADIFFNNCFQNGILPIALPDEKVKELFEKVKTAPEAKIKIDLENQKIAVSDGGEISFDIDKNRKEKLLKGIDDIGFTLQFLSSIESFEKQHLF
ncbi:MAG: 3-isopropylmalate dehydratase small subunit [Spirochaetia bacterium]|nr:3-isopropylmalate dehydratase small subunit [Spirochaetia bacterium]